MIILAGASIFSWAYILQRTIYLKQVKNASRHFTQIFASDPDLSRLYQAETRQGNNAEGLEAIFHAGYREFMRFRKHTGATLETIIENTKRAMRVAQMREQDKLEVYLPFLAIVGSTSPYIGLFGTVWGIMQALGSLANVQQATIALVAPGIAEALIATALGLFVAIPAVIAYSRFVTEVGLLQNQFDAFQEEFTNSLIRQTHHQQHARHVAETEIME